MRTQERERSPAKMAAPAQLRRAASYAATLPLLCLVVVGVGLLRLGGACLDALDWALPE